MIHNRVKQYFLDYNINALAHKWRNEDISPQEYETLMRMLHYDEEGYW